jgi:hypothetical protein
MTTDPLRPAQPTVPPTVETSRRRQSRFRERSLLLNPAPVIGATLAAFALAFGGLTMRLATGHDPALGAAVSSGQVATRGGTVALTTRASGAATAAAGAPAGSKTTSARLVSATSGSARAGATRGD